MGSPKKCSETEKSDWEVKKSVQKQKKVVGELKKVFRNGKKWLENRIKGSEEEKICREPAGVMKRRINLFSSAFRA